MRTAHVSAIRARASTRAISSIAADPLALSSAPAPPRGRHAASPFGVSRRTWRCALDARWRAPRGAARPRVALPRGMPCATHAARGTLTAWHARGRAGSAEPGAYNIHMPRARCLSYSAYSYAGGRAGGSHRTWRADRRVRRVRAATEFMDRTGARNPIEPQSALHRPKRESA